MFMMVLLVVLLTYSWFSSHLLNMFLSLEYLVLFLYYSLLLCSSKGFYFYSLVYLVFSVCEGAMGLSLLILISRLSGGDFFNMMNY